MSEKSLDLETMQREELIGAITQSLEKGDEKGIAEAMAAFGKQIQAEVIREAKSLTAEQSADNSVLAARGVRQLTSAETKFYENCIKAMSSVDPKQEITKLEVAFPETVIDSVFEDMQQSHPLLDLINFVNTNAAIKMIVNKTEIELAVWGKLGTGYTKKLSGAIDEVNTTLYKLSAYMPIEKDMLELGPRWIDRFIRILLSESIAGALESAIISGEGKDTPVGMDRIIGKDATVQDGVYTRKTAKAITDLDPATYGELIGMLATNSETGFARNITDVCLIVNPVDYYKVIMPATTMLTAGGAYANNVLPVPTKVVQSKYMEQGKAIIGLAKRYFMAFGSTKGGRIEYDDSVQFMEDARVYGIKMHGNGMPLDNNAFILLDISGLKPLRYSVTTLTEELTLDDNG